MFKNQDYSDATVFIYGEELPVHCLVICSQSKYFAKAFQDKFLEGEQRQIKFDNDSAAAHWRVFEYLYFGDYSEN